jgi:hypothetical protein
MPWHRALLRIASGMVLVTCIGCSSNLTPTKPGGTHPTGSGGTSPGAGGSSAGGGGGGSGGSVCSDPTQCPSSGQAQWDVATWDKSVWN